jgi:hypothetical protein
MEATKERAANLARVMTIAYQSLGLRGSLVFLLYLEKPPIWIQRCKGKTEQELTRYPTCIGVGSG